MAIATNDAIVKFGTQDTLGNSSASVADAAFSIASDLNTWTNDDDAPMASVTALLDWAVTPDTTGAIHLYAQMLNVQSTNDGEVPDATHQHVYLGSFPVNNVTTNQYITIDVSLPNAYTSQVYQFFIENVTGQTLQAGWDIYITPKTIGPAA